MCCGCWEECNVPLTINDSVRKCADLIDRVYDYSCAGGNCHCVVDDWNVRDSDIDACLRRIAGETCVSGEDAQSADQLDAEWGCMVAMSSLTEAERLSALLIQELGEAGAIHFDATGEVR